jgi:hypothetical protein
MSIFCRNSVDHHAVFGGDHARENYLPFDAMMVSNGLMDDYLRAEF